MLEEQRFNKNTNWKVNVTEMSTARRDKATDGDHAIIFNTDTNQYEGYNGTEWIALAGGGSSDKGYLEFQFSVKYDFSVGDLVILDIYKNELGIITSSPEIDKGFAGNYSILFIDENGQGVNLITEDDTKTFIECTHSNDAIIGVGAEDKEFTMRTSRFGETTPSDCTFNPIMISIKRYN